MGNNVDDVLVAYEAELWQTHEEEQVVGRPLGHWMSLHERQAQCTNTAIGVRHGEDGQRQVSGIHSL